jgi:ribosomal protein S12 methylthiotransferase
MERNNGFKQKRVAIITNNLHCERHVQYFSTIEKYFKTNGWNIAEDFSVNKIIICGCGFHDAMYEKFLTCLKEIRKLNFLEKNIIVMACLPKTQEERLNKDFRGQIVELNHEVLLDDIIHAKVPFKEISPVNIYIANKKCLPENVDYDKFHIKISQGCLRECTFCVINKAKGKIRSIPFDTIAEQVKTAVESGKKKILLMGEDTFAYGIDIDTTIIDLVEKLVEIAPPDMEFYFGYLHIRWLKKYSGKIQDLCKRGVLKELHIGLQHVNDQMLKKMGRPEHFPEIYEIITAIKKENPGFYMVADILVGFPGETEEMFNQLIEFFEKDKCFNKVKHFGYSNVKGAPSCDFEDNIPQEIIAARWDRLDKVLGMRSYSHQDNENRIDNETFRITRFEDYFFCKDTFEEMIKKEGISPELILAESKVLKEEKGDFGF